MNSDRLPSIGLCIPTLNQGCYIEESIHSIISQRYPNIQIIVMDGGSTDNTLSVLEHYKHSIHHLQSGNDGGQAAAINEGLAHSTADLLGWLNSDDVLLPGALFKVAAAWQQGHRLIAGRSAFREATGQSVVWSVHHLPANAREILNYPLDLYLPQPSVFFAASLWHQVGGLDASLHYGMDTDLWIRMARIQPLHLIPEELSWMRLHRDSKTVSRGHLLHRDYRIVLKRNRDLLNPHDYAHLYLASLQRSAGLLTAQLRTKLRKLVKPGQQSKANDAVG